jgi:hypothetical protein
VAFLLVLAWKAIAGALAQLPRARTRGQKLETALQLESGALSMLVAATALQRDSRVETLRWVWGGALAAAAGLSGLVWGPPMPLVGALFAAAGLLVSRLVARALRTAGWDA